MERVLVFGSTGRIGRRVVRRLAADPEREVLAARRWNSPVEALEGTGVDDVVADLEDRPALEHAITGANALVYAAAPDVEHGPRAYLRRSVQYVRRVLSIARDRGVERLVVTSTAATATAAGPGDEPADATDVYLPGNASDRFLEAAYAVEQECFRQAADGQRVCTVNPAFVVDAAARLPPRSAFPDLDDGDPVGWVGPDRVVEAHLRALDRGEPGARYLVGETNGTVRGLYRAVERAGGAVVSSGGLFGRDPGELRDRALIAEGRHLETSRSAEDLGLPEPEPVP